MQHNHLMNASGCSPIMTYSIVLLIIALLSSIISVRQIVKIDPLTALGRED